ncbi:MAG: type III-B CRISPR module-associated protein Cmr5 [Streptosporangiaceae bacterium]
MTALRIDQGMAAAAAEALQGDVDRELRTRYRQLRVMLHTAGLAATYAFIASKAKDMDGAGSGRPDRLAVAYQTAGEAIRKRLVRRGMFPGGAEPRNPREVLTALGTMSQVEYARASAEAAAMVGWLARLADALYKPADEND